MKIKIEFASWACKAALEIEAGNIKEAVEKAVKDGASLDGASLRHASLDGASLDGASLRHASLVGAKHNSKELWKTRPVLQLGCCGSVGRSTLVMFYADKSEPMIYCGCFSGTIEEFEAKIHKQHGGTFHEYEYMAMADHIKAIRKYQLEEKEN